MGKIIVKTGIVFLLLLVTGAGCRKEKEEDPEEFEEKQILKFSDFGCSNQHWYIKPGYVNNHYIINSQQELEKRVTTDCTPQIDFSKFIVLIGSRASTSGILLYNEKLEENNAEIVYTVTFLTQISAVAHGIQYHAVINKPVVNKKFRIVEIVKDRE